MPSDGAPLTNPHKDHARRPARPLQTLATSVGAYILAIETILPDQAIELHSIYTGHANVKTQATQLILAPADTKQRQSNTRTTRCQSCTHDDDVCMTTYTELQDLLQGDGAQAYIPVDDAAIEAIEH